MKKRFMVILVALVTLAALLCIGCDSTDSLQVQQRKESIDNRAETMARAEALYPVPETQNFPLRALLVEYTKRQDLVNHPWYTYIMSDTGAITHYFVSTTVPVSTSAFLSSTEDVLYSSTVVTAPSLDGIYYGGAGSTTGSNGWIFIDAATGAMGIAYGQKILTFDAPLILETEPQLITIKGQG